MTPDERSKMPDKIHAIYVQQVNRVKGFFQNPDPVQVYVGSTVKSAKFQFDFLLDLGLTQSAKVLEIGCGALNASQHLIEFLQEERFVGIDPNPWLREYAQEKSPKLKEMVSLKKVIFLSNDKFDASELNTKFDFILSHSVLSHAAHFQLDHFLKNAGVVLTNHGKILASIRLAEGNVYGSTGTPNRLDSMDEEWVYPGVSYFTKATIEETANRHGLKVTYREDFTRRLTNYRKPEFHDWLVFEKI